MRNFQVFLKSQKIDQSTEEYKKIAFRVKKKLEFFLSWFDSVPIGSPLIKDLIENCSSIYQKELILLKQKKQNNNSNYIEPSSDFSSKLMIVNQ